MDRHRGFCRFMTLLLRKRCRNVCWFAVAIHRLFCALLPSTYFLWFVLPYNANKRDAVWFRTRRRMFRYAPWRLLLPRIAGKHQGSGCPYALAWYQRYILPCASHDNMATRCG
jgi:hypothetical protein